MSITFLLLAAGAFVLLAVVGAMLVVGMQNRRVGGPADYQPTLPSGPAPRPQPQLTGDVEADARALLAQNKKIHAIKRVRELTGLGLKEAKDYVDALEAGARPEAPPTMIGLAEPPALDMAAVDAEARELLARGNTIQAIKLVRQRTGLGLKEAKDYVEGLDSHT